MFFFPFRADIKLSKFPFLTIIICIACLLIYWQQAKSEHEIEVYSNSFCEQEKSRIHSIIMQKISKASNYPEEAMCSAVYLSINYSSDPAARIAEITATTTKFSSKSVKKSHAYINDYLTKKATEFNMGVPSNLSKKLYYKPDSFNVLNMITSAFAHGSWPHVIGNLFFFFAFAATIEAVLGLVFFPLTILGLAIVTNLVYSFAVMSSPEALPTLGLSGVVMGTMGLFTYFIPKAKIRCLYWFIIIIRKFGIPAWILAVWYIGWDVFDLYTSGTGSGVNLVAHVSGFIGGFVIGVTLFRWRKKEIHNELKRSQENRQLKKAMSY